MVDNNNSKNLADQEEEKEKEKQKPTKKVWATLITNLSYLPGLLTLHYSLTKTQTRYPFIALYTSTFPQEGLQVLESRDIPHQRVPHVVPAGGGRQYAHDPRFQDTWTKLVAFSLEQYDRIVLLDGDMLIRRNMDELMDLELDGPELLLEGRGRVFAAAHACACNPLRKGHYPIHWYSLYPFYPNIQVVCMMVANKMNETKQDPRKLRIHPPTHMPQNRPIHPPTAQLRNLNAKQRPPRHKPLQGNLHADPNRSIRPRAHREIRLPGPRTPLGRLQGSLGGPAVYL